MTTRVRQRRPRVLPSKGRQPLPQFGAGSNVTLGDVIAAMFGVKNPSRQRGGNLMKELMMASQPKTVRRQRGRAMPAWLDAMDQRFEVGTILITKIDKVARAYSVSLHGRCYDSLLRKSPNKQPRPWPNEWRKKRPKKQPRER